MPTVLKPASTYMISPVIPFAQGEQRNNAALPTSSIVTLRLSGEIFSFTSSILRNDLIPDAAKVRIGPAEIAFTRIPSAPKLDAFK
jgi:hypothetical protein